MKNKGSETALIREQLAVFFEQIKGLKKAGHRGWIRSIRKSLGMSAKQLATRIEVEPPRITEMEKSEINGNITLRSLRRAAEAMDCELFYALIPKTSLEETMRRQALLTARQRMEKVSHTMLLEGQALGRGEEARILEQKAKELMRDVPRWLWDSTK